MSNEKQLTAVQSLCGKLAMKLGMPQAITFYVDHEQEILEALEMEKEQIENGWYDGYLYEGRMPDYECVADTYYEQTYGGGEQ